LYNFPLSEKSSFRFPASHAAASGSTNDDVAEAVASAEEEGAAAIMDSKNKYELTLKAQH